MDATAQQLLARLRQNPTDGATLSALSAHCEQMGDYALLVDAMEQHARALAEADGDPIEIGRIHFDLGNLYRARIGRADRAIIHYRAAIDYDAAQRPAMAAARAIYTELGKWDQVAKLLNREAESLPPGQKRATVLTELSNVYRDRLNQISEATQALREAAAADPGDLQIQHDLATMLLDQADREPNSDRADGQRREAADVLCDMARAVSDDYAFAYIEAALDAVPDHGQGLSQLEEIAPRVGRSDTIAARWVGGLQMAPTGPLSRGLRLKLAKAYRDVGQVDDARACLEPLLRTRDGEAQALVASLPVKPPAKADLAGPTGEVSLDDMELIESAHSVRLELADDLAALAARDQESEGASSRSLDDLAIVKPSVAPKSAGVSDEALQMLSSVETALPAEEDAAERDADLDAALDAAFASEEDEGIHGEATKPRASMSPARPAPSISHDPSGETDLGQTPQVPLDAASLAEGLSHAAGESAAGEPAQSSDASAEAARAKRRDADATPVSIAPVSDLMRLRGELAKRLRFRDLRGAAELAESILAHDAVDADAIGALEDHYRATRDFRRMRELAMRIGNEPAMDAESRIARLREAAMLSESKLGDVEGTIAAWRALVKLAPHDDEGRIKLRKLLTRQQRWDELVQVLDEQALGTTDPAERAQAYREIASLHRDKRNNLNDAIETLGKVRELSPDHAPDEVLLSELLLAAERFAEAASVFEDRLVRADTEPEKLTLLRVLADVYETRLADDERAYEASAQILRFAEGDVQALDRMERIDERQARFDRLLETLLTRADSRSGIERVSLLARAAELARTKTGDLARATALYGDALALVPGDEALTNAAEIAFDEAGRSEALTGMLADQAAQATDKSTRLFLQRKVATRLSKSGDLDAAITAHQALLAIEVDVETLRSLTSLLQRADGRDAELAQHLDALALRVDVNEARDVRFARASLLANQLRDPEAAKNELRTIFKTLVPGDTAALEMLVQLGTDTQDDACVAEAQELQLALSTDDELRVDLARSLADLYEGPLDDRARAIAALEVWASLDLVNPQAYLRLVPLLEAERKFSELRTALDTLATLSIADDEASEFLLRAAKISMYELGDHEGAWQRLVPRVVDAGDAQAEEMLRELARMAGRGEQLAQLFVGLAQRAEDDEEQMRRWTDAAQTYETMVGSVDKALEAALRALAKDMTSTTMLGEVDRLAAAAGAWPRLAQVYDALARRGEDVDARVKPLLRHASLLEHKAGDLSAAFDRVALAFSLDPGVDDVYAEASRLGHASGRIEDLLSVHERRAVHAHEVDQKIDALIEACRIAQQVLEDSPRATGALSRAVGLASSDDGALDKIERVVKMLDESQPPLDGRGLTHALCEVYKLRAEEGRKEPKLAAELLRRAAILLEHDQGNLEAAYRSLERAAALAPTDEAILDALVSLAERAHTLEPLTKHFMQAAEDAIDSSTASVALRRLGHLFETALASPDKAAEVYRQLMTLRPRDVEIANKLRACLKAAGQFKELLVAIDRQLALVTTLEERKPLLQEAAEAWETGLKNRFEARDAWKKVLKQFPGDAAAVAALARLEVKAVFDESDLLEADLVVRPEDLRPTHGPISTPPDTTAGAVESSPAAMNESAEAEAAEQTFTDGPSTVSDTEVPPAASEHDVESGSEGDAEASQRTTSEPQEPAFEQVSETGADLASRELAQALPEEREGAEQPAYDVLASQNAHEAYDHERPDADDDDEDADDALGALAAQARAYADESHDTDPPPAPAADMDEEVHEADDDAEEVAGYTTATVTDMAPAPLGAEGSELEAERESTHGEPLPAEPMDTDPGELRPPPAEDLLAGLASLDARAEELADADADDAELVESGAIQLDDSGAMQLDDSGALLLEDVDPSLDESDAASPIGGLDTLSNMLERGAIRTTPPTKSRIPPPPPSSAQNRGAPTRPSAPPPPLPRRTSAAPQPESGRGNAPPLPPSPRGTVPPLPQASRGTVPPLPESSRGNGSVPPSRDDS